MSWTLMDQRLAESADELRRIGVPNAYLGTVATSIRDEVVALNADILRDSFSARYPDAASVNDQLIYNWTFSEQRFDLIYGDDAVNQTAVLATNYLYFVYAQDTYFEAILSASSKLGPSRPIAKFLTSGDVRSFRNAFAHGRWRYVGSSNLLDIEFLEGGKPDGEVRVLSHQKLVFWHLLSKTVLGLWSARIADLRQPLHDLSQVSQ
jgi:hypothetical protein